MIQSWLVSQIVPLLPGYEVTVDNESDGKNAATVFYEGGAEPGDYDFAYAYPQYMIWLGSADFGTAEYNAYELVKQLNRRTPVIITVEFTDKDDNVIGTQDVFVRRLKVDNGPNRLGIEDGRMFYTINLTATITLKGGSAQ